MRGTAEAKGLALSRYRPRGGSDQQLNLLWCPLGALAVVIFMTWTRSP